MRKGELEGRLDANTYHPQRKNAVSRLKKSCFNVEKLCRVSTFQKNIVTSVRETDIYIGLENVESNTGIFVDSERKESISTALAFSKGQVLFPKLRPYLNKVFYANFDGICSTEFHVLDSNELNNKYLCYFLGLSVVVQQTSLLMSGNTLPRLQTEDVKNLLIPIPPLAIQSEIVARMDAAYADKKQKEAEAQRLLESIDGYLLGELGIELPEKEENTLRRRIFRRKFSEISGGRLDAPVYQKTYLLETKKFPMMKFKECVIINPLVSFSGYHPEKLASFLPMEKVSDRYGEAEISDCRTVNESGGYTKFKENDLLWAKITPCMQNGKSAVVNGLNNGIGFGSTEFHVFRAKNEVDIQYIHGILRLVSLRKYAMLYFSGSAGHQRVSGEFFAKLSVPLPPLSVQTEIACRIAEIRSRAKQLQQEANDGLEQAKRETETLILGYS